VYRKLSALRTELNNLRTTQLLNVAIKSPTVKTFTLKDRLCAKAKPGQFLMLWIPNVDEIPLSIMKTEGSKVSVSVKQVGVATRHMHKMKGGETIGVRGPFGNSFSQTSGKALLVGGGTGTAPLIFLAKQLQARKKQFAFVVGAKTKTELLFLNDLNQISSEQSIIATTEDGTYGLHCCVTKPLVSLLAEQQFDMIYTCGPELMVSKIFNLAEHYNVPLEASLERLMRCGIGLCGSCVIGKYRVCRDGPVFNSKQLREFKNELGISKLGFDGTRITI